jgi:2-octaprenyl-6-methoxyphenol hydroxylase
MAYDDAMFSEVLQSELGYRLGVITRVGKRSSYPLYRVKVVRQYQSRLLLLGNAAHTVSPVSAQGLNLGVRGIERLLKVLLLARDNHNDIGSLEVLEDYQQKSQSDQAKILAYTDDLMTWFKIDEPFINSFRSLGLLTVNAHPGLKRYFYHLAGGLN